MEDDTPHPLSKTIGQGAGHKDNLEKSVLPCPAQPSTQAPASWHSPSIPQVSLTQLMEESGILCWLSKESLGGERPRGYRWNHGVREWPSGQQSGQPQDSWSEVVGPYDKSVS